MNDKRRRLFARMKTASSRFHAKKRELIKSRWYAWVDRSVYSMRK